MSHTTTRKAFRDIPKDWAGLINLYPLMPVHDEVGYDSVCEIIDAMAGHDLNNAQEDYLESLSLLVEDYERQHYAICAKGLSPVGALRFLLRENGMSGSDLGRLLGQRTLGSAILAGKRNLSKAHIKTLAARFKVNPSLFL